MVKRVLHRFIKLMQILFAMFLILFILYMLTFPKLMAFGSKAYPMPEHELKENELTPIDCPQNYMVVLSIDGGGSKGILPIVYLANMKRDSGQEVPQMFNMIGAISTGALIATALSLPDEKNKSKPAMSPEELVKDYFKQVAYFFQNRLLHRIITLNGIIGPVLDANYKNDYLKASYKTASISDLLTKVVIFTYDLKAQKLRAICNLEACHSKLNNYYLSSLVAAATNAVVVFPPMSFFSREGELEYVISDPAALINNPSYFTYNQAKKVCPKTKHIVVLSFGTGQYSDFEDISQVTYWGLSDWIIPLLSASINTNSALVNYSLNHEMLFEAEKNDNQQLPHLIYLRINPSIPLDISSPFSKTAKQLSRLKNIAEKTYQQQEKLLTCIANITKKDAFEPHCIGLIKEHMRSSKIQVKIRKLPDFMY